MDNTTHPLSLLIKMTLTAWDVQNNYLKNHIHALSDDQLAKEVAPGKNSGIYLLGHLIAVSDAMFPLLGIGDRLYPEMETVFITSPDKSGHVFPAVTELRLRLDAVNQRLSSAFAAITNDEWLSRHSVVSAEDFTGQPHRNKLNVVISRTNHMAGHVGQLLLLK
jgi:DinB superfamily